MREILFRGFHPCEDGSKTVIVNGKPIIGNWKHGDLTHGCNRGKIYIVSKYSFPTEVIPETVGQFTGALDSHGYKIFEGDTLISGEWEDRIQVVWGYNELAWMVSDCGIEIEFINEFLFATDVSSVVPSEFGNMQGENENDT